MASVEIRVVRKADRELRITKSEGEVAKANFEGKSFWQNRSLPMAFKAYFRVTLLLCFVIMMNLTIGLYNAIQNLNPGSVKR